MMENETVLYKNHKNSIGYWRIYSIGNVIHMESSPTMQGFPIRHEERVTEGKQGRSLLGQTKFRIDSRIKNKLDNGYVRTPEEAKKPPTNALDLAQPMLAQPLKNLRGKIDLSKVFVQKKYNGHRCLITKKDGELFAYSRRGLQITTIKHILDGIGDIEDGVTLDGELYCHGVPLQQIASWAKRLQAGTKDLFYVIYDVITPEPFIDRYRYLNKRDTYGKNAFVADTWRLMIDLNKQLKESKDAGYEGLILRTESGSYAAGRRSNDLIKVKSVIDAEFVVVDVIPSKDEWGILVCQLPNGGTFKVSAPGTISEKEHVLKNKDKYIGRWVTVEFAEYTKDKVPFHGVATQFRVDL